MEFKLFLLVLVAKIACSYGAGGGVAIESQAEVEIEDNSSAFTRRLIPGRAFALECNNAKEDDTLAIIQWYKDDAPLTTDDHLTLTGNGSLHIGAANASDAGIYVCQESLPIDSQDKPIHHEFQVYALMVRLLKPSRMVVEGAVINITCDVTGTPVPSIVWRKDGEVITNGSSEGITITQSDGFTPETTLLIPLASNAHRGNYSCTIDNTDGAAPVTMSTNLRVKGLYAALWPFLGIVAEVVLLCAIILFFERRRSNAEYEESDTDTGKNGQ